MKPSNPKSHFKFLRNVDLTFAWALIVAAISCGAAVRAEEEDAKPAPGEPTTGTTDQQPTPVSNPEAAPPVQRSAAGQPSAEGLSPLVTAVIKMADASVSPVVIKTYVECSSSVDPLTDADVIALKKHNVADEIVTTLLTQGAKRRAQNTQRKLEVARRVLEARQARSGVADPESYEYFRYHYLQPRAAASVYRRLSPYFGPRGFYGHGLSPAHRFRYPSHGRPRY